MVEVRGSRVDCCGARLSIAQPSVEVCGALAEDCSRTSKRAVLELRLAHLQQEVAAVVFPGEHRKPRFAVVELRSHPRRSRSSALEPKYEARSPRRAVRDLPREALPWKCWPAQRDKRVSKRSPRCAIFDRITADRRSR